MTKLSNEYNLKFAKSRTLLYGDRPAMQMCKNNNNIKNCDYSNGDESQAVRKKAAVNRNSGGNTN